LKWLVIFKEYKKLSTLAHWHISKGLLADARVPCWGPLQRIQKAKLLRIFDFFCFQYAYKSKLLARLKTKKASLKASFLILWRRVRIMNLTLQSLYLLSFCLCFANVVTSLQPSYKAGSYSLYLNDKSAHQKYRKNKRRFTMI